MSSASTGWGWTPCGRTAARLADWFGRIKARSSLAAISDYPPDDYDDTGRDGASTGRGSGADCGMQHWGALCGFLDLLAVGVDGRPRPFAQDAQPRAPVPTQQQLTCPQMSAQQLRTGRARAACFCACRRARPQDEAVTDHWPPIRGYG